jgi:hypothetical protein
MAILTPVLQCLLIFAFFFTGISKLAGAKVLAIAHVSVLSSLLLFEGSG